jgi:hypothetical protein
MSDPLSTPLASPLPNPIFDLSERVTMIPVVHGSAFFAREVRHRLKREAAQGWDCLAVALPPSFAAGVEESVERLPRVSVVVQQESDPAGENGMGGASYVPVEPCQALIEALRVAQTAGIARAWVDLEVENWEPPGDLVLPDAYPLPTTGLEAFAAACLPVLPTPEADSQHDERLRYMAQQLHLLELEHTRVVLVCSLADWPWIRQAYHSRSPYGQPFGRPQMPLVAPLSEQDLYFVLGELPYLSFLYEHRRAEEIVGHSDAKEVVDGVKTLLIEARDRALKVAGEEHSAAAQQASTLTPRRLRILLQYARNLTLLDGRMTPQLFDLALAAKQVIGDDYALSLIETARQYPPQRIGPDRGNGGEVELQDSQNRLLGSRKLWRNLHLRPTPPAPLREQWKMEWDPHGQCSYPPEDTRIENFQQHVRDQARALLGLDLPRVEKFTASLQDGLDLRETLRNWHSGDLYVKQMPPSRGNIEVVVMLFEVPAEPAVYPWRSTWYAEHDEESTLCFFATPHEEGIVGPGIGQSIYGGCMFIFPPRPIPDVWTDPRLAGYDQLEDKLLAAACMHSQERRVVLVAPKAPSTHWRRLARGFGRQLVYLPMRRFSADTVDRLRRFHVLNGRQVRSYAARYIRPPR